MNHLKEPPTPLVLLLISPFSPLITSSQIHSNIRLAGNLPSVDPSKDEWWNVITKG